MSNIQKPHPHTYPYMWCIICIELHWISLSAFTVARKKRSSMYDSKTISYFIINFIFHSLYFIYIIAHIIFHHKLHISFYGHLWAYMGKLHIFLLWAFMGIWGNFFRENMKFMITIKTKNGILQCIENSDACETHK